MIPTRHNRWTLFIPIVLAISLAAPDAIAQTATWNQERVTAVAEQMAGAVNDLRSALRRQPDPGLSTMQSRARHQLRDELRLIENETKHLARRLKDGAGLDETLPVYQRLGQLIRRARENANKQYIQESVRKRIEAARGFWEQLTSYYAGAAE